MVLGYTKIRGAAVSTWEQAQDKGKLMMLIALTTRVMIAMALSSILIPRCSQSPRKLSCPSPGILRLETAWFSGPSPTVAI